GGPAGRQDGPRVPHVRPGLRGPGPPPGTTPPPVRPAPAPDPALLLKARGVTVTYQGVPAVREVDLDLRGGAITALMGRNGSGKSSLLWALQGTGPRKAGTVLIPAAGGGKDADPQKLSPSRPALHRAVPPLHRLRPRDLPRLGHRA
ncbi:ATP-binding cassette domain-containing protein, partial [Streptomyces sp. SID13726]|nr:ATP-binding cassette domain-containing protein [Streptomyces sp. SID13726]